MDIIRCSMFGVRVTSYVFEALRIAKFRDNAREFMAHLCEAFEWNPDSDSDE